MTRLSLIAALLAVPALLGCGDEDPFTTRQSALTRVCGVNKYQGPQGVDVSTYQPNYNWAAQAAAGVRYGYARFSNGTQIIDDQFERNWPEMKAQGIYRGAYQYFRPGQDAVAQANMMVNRLGMLGPGDMPAMIDVETADGQSAAVVAAKVREWIDIVEAGTGKKPTIYTGAYFWQDNVGDSSFGEYPLWIANYGADCPLVPDGWTNWTFWQYCDGNTDYCTNGMGFDRDVFNGTDDQLDELANGGNSYSADVLEVSEQATIQVGGTHNAFVVVQNTGTSTWDSSTKLATTEPRDRMSAHAGAGWEAPNRVAAVAGTVAPGESYRFEFELTTSEVGHVNEAFGLVQDGITWFADEGGPADDAIRIELDVVDSGEVIDPDPADPADPRDPTDPTTNDPNSPGDPQTSELVPPVVGESPGVEGGCSQTGSSASPWGFIGLLVLVSRRRRSL